ncbi:MAG: hypothetical protein LBU18_01040, partial [Treponema sp.]|nr:hypothetical protein [Treponema sp.]
MLKEAASFDSYKKWRAYTEAEFSVPTGEFEFDTWLFSEEELDAWYKTFWENAVKAVDSSEQNQEGAINGDEKASPAELDREFLELTADPGGLENFA